MEISNKQLHKLIAKICCSNSERDSTVININKAKLEKIDNKLLEILNKENAS